MLSCVVLSCVYVVLSCCVGRVSVDHMQAQLDHVLARGAWDWSSSECAV